MKKIEPTNKPKKPPPKYSIGHQQSVLKDVMAHLENSRKAAILDKYSQK